MLQFKIRTLGIVVAILSLVLATFLHAERWRKIKDADERLNVALAIIHFDIRDRIECDDGYSERGLNCLRPLPFEAVEDVYAENRFLNVAISNHFVLNDKIDVRSKTTCSLGLFADPVVELHDCNASENQWFIEELSKAAASVGLELKSGG